MTDAQHDWQVICGDACDVLRAMPEKSVHLCVTSPPFWNLRDYDHDAQIGREPTPEKYVDSLVSVFREVRRVLRDDGTIWVNVGDCYARDPKKGVKFEAKSKATYLRNRQADERNTGGEIPPNLKPKCLVGIPWLLAFALRNDGWVLRNDAPWVKFNGSPSSVTDRLTVTHEYLFMFSKTAAGYFYDVHGARKPSTMRPQRRSSRAHAGMPPNTWSSAVERDVPAHDGGDTRQRRTTNAWRESLDAQIEYLTRIRDEGGILVDDEGHVGGVLCAVAQSKVRHFATYPVALVEPLVRLCTSEHGVCSTCGSPYERVVEKTKMVIRPSERRDDVHAAGGGSGRTVISGTMVSPTTTTTTTTGWQKTCRCTSRKVIPSTVLDPFNGSGTTGVVATTLGRRYIGIDLNENYVEMSCRRIGGGR